LLQRPIGRSAFVDEEPPRFLASLLSVEKLELRVRNAAEFGVGSRRFGPVASADQMH